MRPVRTKTRAAARRKRKPAAKTEYLDFAHLDRAAETALYYGFTPLPAPLVITKEDRELARSCGETEAHEGVRETAFAPFIEQKAALLRWCLKKGIADGPLPVLFYSEGPPTPASSRKDGQQTKRLSLDIIGSGKSVNEALLIKTVWTTLKEEGAGEPMLAINSVGDRESLLKFTRELGSYYRRNIHLLPAPCRAALRRDPLLALSCAHEKCKPLNEGAPKAMGFLSEASRVHFKEVLEYIEALEIPYRIDHCLTAGKSFAGETVFELRLSPAAKTDGSGERVCFGFRYNGAAKKIGFHKDIPAIGATMLLPRSVREIAGARAIRMKKPRIFFLQLGFDAKLQCLKVVETLRQARIPLYQAVARDKLATQLASAENLKMPYSLIMGQKEAFEDSVIVRDNATRAQETVQIGELVMYLKKLKLV